MPLTDNDYNEKRNFIRMFVNAKVKITDPTTGNVFEGIGKNLSGDGAMFTTNEKFKVDQTLSVDISSEQSPLTALSASFEVVRVDEIGDGQFEIAGTMKDVK